MKIWKLLILVPYAVEFLWIFYWIGIASSLGLAAIVIVPLFVGYGVIAIIAYSAILAVSLIARWFILRWKK